MLYKVFFVEDEIVTREGIRDNVDWKAHGFEFCGEAPDGEMALPLLQTIKPDVLITDIRMPFMDGLQLSQIVRDRMPATKIIILSGHDEFEYAQKAIKLGVSEYLLKPVSVQDLHNVLQKVASELEQERGEQQALQRLQDQVEENRAALRERFLLKLVTGVASSTEAIEKSQMLGIDFVAQCYLVVVIRIEPLNNSEPIDYQRCQVVQQLVSDIVENNPDVFLLRKDIDELVLVMKGNSPENLHEERDLLLARIKPAVEQKQSRLAVGSGPPQKRITDICQSFIGATDSLQAVTSGRRAGFSSGFDNARLLRVNKSAVEDYLRFGVVEGFSAFFETFIRPLGENALRSSVARDYILTDIVLTTARFVDQLGGNVAQVIPELDDIETVLPRVETAEQLEEQAREVLVGALVFRDRQVNNQHAGVIKQAQEYIDRYHMDPDMALNGVAAQVNLSPCHFSAVFSQETGQTFKEYLTEIRIKRAKELLRTTTLKAFEICYQVGYNDPHYFSHVFRKHTGLTPIEFRLQAQTA
jgi:two-component system, response regulator YesN